jgi:hypothetical protein
MAAFRCETKLHPQGRHDSSEKETAMNLTTIASIPSSNLKRIKGQYVVAAAGIALLASGVLGAAPWQQESKPVTNVNHVANHNTLQAVPMQVYHIVASEAERDMLATEFGGNFVVKGSDREALLFGDQSASMTAAGVDFRIIDTTTPDFSSVSSGDSAANPAIAASVRSTEDALYGLAADQRSVSDADIMASVLSTELANYLSPLSFTPRASDADITASVLSTNRAAYDFSASRPAQRQALDTDIMASVISTEKAAGY